jgi:hypothetical protein
LQLAVKFIFAKATNVRVRFFVRVIAILALHSKWFVESTRSCFFQNRGKRGRGGEGENGKGRGGGRVSTTVTEEALLENKILFTVFLLSSVFFPLKFAL